MNRSPFLAAALLPSLLLACSGGGGAPTPTPSATATTAAASGGTPTPKAGAGGAPVVTGITFEPAQSHSAPTVTTPIRVSARTSDPDGDGVTVQWRWFINGNEVAGVLTDTLAPRWTKGDKVEVEATPRDSHGNVGSPNRAFVLIRNSVPTISSRPAGSLNGYKAVVQDPDSTSPTERFTWALEPPVPPGFSLSADGTLKFDAVAGKAANGQKVTIMVTDSAGALSKQTFDVKF